jgi:hypothetical protein
LDRRILDSQRLERTSGCRELIVISVICVMLKHKLTILFALAPVLLLAQLPELEILRKNGETDTDFEAARNSFQQGQYEEAQAKFFQLADKNKLETRDYLLFGSALVASGKKELAKEMYEVYLERRNQKEVPVSGQLNSILHRNESIYLKSTADLTSPVGKPSYSQNKLHLQCGGSFESYYTDCNGALTPASHNLAKQVNGTIGSASFYNEGNSVVFSLLGSNNTYEIYAASKGENGWKRFKRIFASKDGHYAFPYVDEKNGRLYFSSTVDGGFGGYDLYVSLMNGKSFGEPVNLGSSVNTPQNEISPTIFTEYLYFSSNGYLSKGGYDIYKFQSLSEYNTILRNCISFNTNGDELGLTPINHNRFYVVSSNNGETKLHYLAKQKVVVMTSGEILNTENQPIKGAQVLIPSAQKQDQGVYATSNEQGLFFYQSATELALQNAKIQAEGYKTSTVDLLENSSIVLERTDEVKQEFANFKPTTTYHPTTPKDVEKEEQDEIANESQPQHSERVWNIANLKDNNQLDETVSASKESAIPSTRSSENSYYVIVGSTTNRNYAISLQKSLAKKFEGLEIIERNPGRYRLGYYAGNTLEESKRSLEQAKLKQQQVWLLTPAR